MIILLLFKSNESNRIEWKAREFSKEAVWHSLRKICSLLSTTHNLCLSWFCYSIKFSLLRRVAPSLSLHLSHLCRKRLICSFLFEGFNRNRLERLWTCLFRAAAIFATSSSARFQARDWESFYITNIRQHQFHRKWINQVLTSPRETNKTSHIIYELGILCSYNDRLPVSKVTNNFSSPTAKNLTDVFITVKLLISRMPIKCLASDKKRIIILFPLHTTKAVSFLASLIIKRWVCRCTK